MTIVIGLKVGDGLVLGADSASTIVDGGLNYQNSYFNAEKLFNLVKGLPLGLVTFGLGGLGGRSISAHVKDLRRTLCDRQGSGFLEPASYRVAEVAERVRAFFYEDLYRKFVTAPAPGMGMGFLIAGYSANGTSGEIWKVLVDDTGSCPPASPLVPESADAMAVWEGQGEACFRLLRGWSPQIVKRLTDAGMSQQDALNLVDSVQPLIHSTMPIQDAIDLVDFLVEMTCGFVRFAPGPATVAKPIDTATITRHEGFRWVHRKHYYPRELNLPHPGDA